MFRIWEHQQWGCCWVVYPEQLSCYHDFVCQQLLRQRPKEVPIFLELDNLPKQPIVLLQASSPPMRWTAQSAQHDTYGRDLSLHYHLFEYRYQIYSCFFLNQMELFKNPIISAHWSTSSSNLLMWQLYMFKVTRTESWSEISYQIIAVVCHLFTFHMTSPEQHGQFQPNSIKHPKGDANLLK